jgi:membrane protein DedA with SNARE-associated domain
MNKYLILLPLLVVQGPLTAIISSFMASPAGGSKFNLVILYVLVVFVDMFTDTIAYFLGRYGKEWLVSRYPKRISISPLRFSVIEEYFKAEGLQTLVVGKLSHGIGWPTMIVAGSARVPYHKFMAVNTAVSVVKSAAFVALGYYYGRHYPVLLQYLGKIGMFFTLILAVFIAYFILTKKRRR